MSGIFVVVEQREAEIRRLSWEAVTAGQQLAAKLSLPVSAIILGAQTESLADELANYAISKVVRIEHTLLTSYTADGFSLALDQFFHAEKPDYVVFPHTYQVRDYAPTLATRIGQVLIGDVIAIQDGPVFVRPLQQGRLHGHYRHSGTGPCFLSVQAGAFALPTANSSHAPISIFTPTISPQQIRVKPHAPFRATAHTVDLASAPLIVSVGRGIKAAENIPLAQDLATALGAELAASRPICDNGWLPLDRQVGSSGQTVAPKLYLAVGISGAIQHQVGIKASQCIVAINNDPDAPIFEIADYGIVADLFDILPALIEAVKVTK
jgi:electron transfer flavoprotein alpha subunit